MKPSFKIILAIAALASLAATYLLSNESPAPSPHPEDIIPDKIVYSEIEIVLPTIELPNLSTPHAALLETLNYSPPVKRIGSWFEMGSRLAQDNPEAAFAALEPTIWEAPYYDLRGSLAAEWLRLDPDSFIEWADKTYPEIIAKYDNTRFPNYQISNLVPHEALAILSHFSNNELREDLKEDIIYSLIEIDPEALAPFLTNPEDAENVLYAASYQGENELTLSLWDQLEYPRYDFHDPFVEHLAKEGNLQYYPHFTEFDQNVFLLESAIHNPKETAEVALSYTLDIDSFYNDFEKEHTPFLLGLINSSQFWEHPELVDWIDLVGGANQAVVSESLLAELAKRENLTVEAYETAINWGVDLIEPKQLENIFLDLDPTHPLTALIEAEMIMEPEIYGTILALKAAKEHTTPERIINALQYGNLENWPPELVSTARETLAALPNEELLWQLSPDTLLSMSELDSKRIESLLTNAPAEWIATTLSSRELINELSINQLPALENLLKYMPDDIAAEQLANAQNRIILRAYQFNTPIAEVASMVSTTEQALLLGLSSAFSGSTDFTELTQHEHSKEIMIGTAHGLTMRPPSQLPLPPELQSAYELAIQAKNLDTLHFGQTLATLEQSQPDTKIALAKAALFQAVSSENANRTSQILTQPSWSSDELQELEELEASLEHLRKTQQ